eukprot:61245_1
MSSCWFQLLFIVLIICQWTINAQTDQRFYFFDFNGQADWTEENPTIIYSSTSGNCQNTPCWDSTTTSSAIHSIPVTLYHTMRIIIDVEEASLKNNAWCYIQYKTPVTSWINVNILTKNAQANDGINFQITLPNTADYNAQPSLQIRLGNSGNGGAAGNCYFDNLEIWGTSYATQDPTTSPTTASPTTAT